MKKLIISFLFLLVITLSPIMTVNGYDESDYDYGDEQIKNVKINLTSSKAVQDFGVICYPDLAGGAAGSGYGACSGNAAHYSASTFEVDVGNGNGAKYYGYCMDPGYAFGGGIQGATCTKKNNSDIKYLLNAAGANSQSGTEDAKVYELALRLKGIVDDYSRSSVDREIGRGLNQVMDYLETSFQAEEQAYQECGSDRSYLKGKEFYTEAEMEVYQCYISNYKENIVDAGIADINIGSFIVGEAANLFRDAYWLIRDMERGDFDSSAYENKNNSYDLDLNNVTCNSKTQFVIPIKSKYAEAKEVNWSLTGKVSGSATESGDSLIVTINPAQSEFNCESMGATFGVKLSYKGGTDGDVYLCSPNSGNQQSILVSTGANSMVPGSSKDGENESVQRWNIPLPDCAQELNNGCTGCSPTPVTVKSTGGSPNCCSDAGANGSAQDQANGVFDINEIFDENKELGLQLQKIKCQAISATKAKDFDASMANSDTATMKKYCAMYCLESSSAHIPGPVEVTSGRYFTLPISPEMNATGTRDCRIQINYNDFIIDYMKVIDREITHYNNFQKNGAMYGWYKEVTDTFIDNNTKEDEDFTFRCSRPRVTCKSCEEVDTGRVDKNGDPIMKTVCDYEYIDGDTQYPSANLQYYYVDYKSVSTDNYPIQQVKAKHDTGEGKANSKVEIEKATSSKATQGGPGSPRNKAYWTFDIVEDRSDVDDVLSDYEECPSGYDGGPSRYTCTVLDGKYNTIKNNEYRQLEYHRDSYDLEMQSGSNSLMVAATEAKKLEESMYECEHYFTEGDGANTGNHYKMNVRAGLTYDLVYNKDNGEVNAMSQDAKIQSNCGVGVSETDTRAYSGKWGGDGNSEFSVTDFSNTANYDYLANKDDFEVYLDDERIIDKSFKVSGRYSGYCSYDDVANTYNTLFAGGLATQVYTPVNNYTVHSRVYHAPLTNYTARIEIRYQMSGFGSQVMRNFDSYYTSGTTCSGMSKSSTGTAFACYYDSKQKLVTTGRCRDGQVVSIANYQNHCGPYCEGNDCDKIHNFNFKTVDPSLLFPNGTQSGKYAQNWVLTKEGKIVQSQIEHDDTFNPSNLTYSFSFTSGDLNIIKKYNESRVGSGGYSDFRLTCKCGQNGNGQVTGNEVCHECISEFITKLYDKKIEYKGQSYTLSMDKVWGNDKLTLNQIRGNGINHWSRDTTVENPR